MLISKKIAFTTSASHKELMSQVMFFISIVTTDLAN